MKTYRVLGILMELLKKEKTTAVELANKFEVSERTILRDIDEMSKTGIPVISHRGINGGFSILPNYKLDKYFFNDNDIKNLIIALNILSVITVNNDIKITLNKMLSIAPKSIDKLLEEFKDYFVVDLEENEPEVIDQKIKIISNAMDEEVKLIINYNNKKIKFEPLTYVLKNNGLYLYGYSDEYLTVNLDCIDKIEITDEDFHKERIEYKQYNKKNLYKHI